MPYRHQVSTARLGAVNAEEIDLIRIHAPRFRGTSVVAIRAARGEGDGAVLEPTRLALNLDEPRAELDDQVIPGVLPKRQKQLETGVL